MQKGFVRIPKRLFETKWSNQKRIYSEFDAVIDIYSCADKNNKLTVSIRSLASKWLWEQTKVLRFLSKLSKEGYISMSKSVSGTIITIIDFGVSATQSATPSATQSATPQTKKCNTETPINTGIEEHRCNTIDFKSATPIATPSAAPSATSSRAYMNDISISMSLSEDNKTDKTIPLNPPRGYEDYDFSFVDDSLLPVVYDWLEYRKERRDKKYTPRGLKVFYNKLNELSSGSADAAKQIVEQSYANNWAGIFKLNDNNNGNKTTQYDNKVGSPCSDIQSQTLRIIERLEEERRVSCAAVR